MRTNIYAKRDHEALGQHYLHHIDRMAVEGLHSKSAIAGELAHRDDKIARMESELARPESLAVSCMRAEIAALKDKYGDLENKSCAEIGRLNVEIAALKVENAKLEVLCDKTYVAQGADAYDHACEVLEAWQEKRIAQGKEPGCVGSLCGGMEWLYAQVSGQESEIAALRHALEVLIDIEDDAANNPQNTAATSRGRGRWPWTKPARPSPRRCNHNPMSKRCLKRG